MPFSPARKFKLEELNRDERYLMLPIPLRHLALSLLMYVDGRGRANASARELREVFYEFDEDITPKDVDLMLLGLEEHDWLLLYTVGRRILLQINPSAMTRYLSIDARDASQFPDPDPAPVFAQRVVWGDSGWPPAEGRGDGGDPGTPASDAWMHDPEMPPPQGCRKHPNNTGLIACGACAGARKVHEQFARGEITHEEAVAAWSSSGREPGR